MQTEVSYLENQQAQAVAKAKETIGHVASLQSEVISLQEQQADMHAKATSTIEKVALLQIRRLTLQENQPSTQALYAFTEEEQNLLHRQAASLQDIAVLANEQVANLVEEATLEGSRTTSRRRYSDPPRITTRLVNEVMDEA